MRLSGRGLLALFVFLAACAEVGGNINPDTGYLDKVPEAVREIADPSQDLTAVALNPEDGCYWYLHDGPVEATMLPLRTRDGRPICSAAAKRALEKKRGQAG